MRPLLWPQTRSVGVVSDSTCGDGTTGEGAALSSVYWSARAQPATVVADTTVEGAALSSVHSVSFGTGSHCVAVHLI